MPKLPIFSQTRIVAEFGATISRIRRETPGASPETKFFRLPRVRQVKSGSDRLVGVKQIFSALLCIGILVSFQGETAQAKKGRALHLENSPTQTDLPRELDFVPNAGQWPPEVRFRAEVPGFTAWVTNSGLIYQFTRAAHDRVAPQIPLDSLSPHAAPAIETYTVRASFVDAHNLSTAVGQQMHERTVDFFLGGNTTAWKTDLPVYGQVVVPELYPGINLLLSSTNGCLQYDFVVAPGAYPEVIEVRYEGIDGMAIGDDGALKLSSPWGNLSEQAPVAFQFLSEQPSRTSVSTTYELRSGNSFGFEVPDGYDRSQPLVIDPIISYSSYVGGSADDGALDVRVLADSTAIIVGYTASTNFPKLPGVDTSYNGAPNDIFVSKVNKTGTAFLFSTYIGGSGDDVAASVTSDASGNLYLTGYTTSTNFPTVAPIDGTSNGDWDAFVLRLNAAGNSLAFSTYIGGSNKDRGDEIARDPSGNIYVAGFTRSTNFPVTAAAVDTSANGGWDAFVLKLNSAGSSVTYATYLGGSLDEFAYGLAVDTAGNAFVVGQTTSTNYPIASALQAANAGSTDGFLTKLNAAGSALVYSTYFGGGQADWIEDIGLDKATDKVYLVGTTASTNFPTAGAYDNTYDGGGGDCFASRIAASGAALQFSTYIGGSGFDRPTAMVLDDSLRINFTGYSSSLDYPVASAIDASPDSTEVIVSRLSPNGNLLQFSTFLGGTANDYGYSADFLPSSQDLYITGTTNSINYPDLFQIPSARGSGYDAFLTRIAPFFDADGDGIADGVDNCISVPNPSQSNADGDAFGDACDLCTDTDGDGFGNPGYPANTCPVDNCPTTSNPTQANTDGDAFGNACDLCPLDPLNDADGDGICANVDNCPTRYNPLQEDSNNDGVGDSCSNTMPGSNVTVNLPGGITVTFPSVTKAGLTDVVLSHTGPAADGSFGIIPISNSLYYYFSTTALYTGNITVCITYNQADVTGNESSLTMRSRHTGNAWTNVTSSLNITTNVICGAVPSLSIIAIATTACCQGLTGNVDCDPTDAVDIADLTALVDNLFVSFDPLCCAKEANVDGIGGTVIDIGDLTRLVDHLFISFAPLAACQ